MREQTSTPNWRKFGSDLPAGSDFVPPGEGFPVKKILALNLGKWKDTAGLQIAQTLHTFAYGYQRYREGKFVLKATSDLGLGAIFASVDEWETFDQFEEFFKPWTFIRRPLVATRWMEDAEFGRQRLVGINPAHIRRATSRDLSDFLGGAEHRSITLAHGRTLEMVRDSGDLYFIDYRIFKDIVDDDVQEEVGKYPLAPMCLLHQSAPGKLVPVAIRLVNSHAGNGKPLDKIFTPSDPPDDWLTAKIAVASADAIYQGQVTHLLYAHLIMEPFAVSTYRNLPATHPLHQLLRPHFFNTLAINELARQRFLGRGRFFDITSSLASMGSFELLRRAYAGTGIRGYRGKPWRFYESALPYDLSARDVGSLSGYHYRDDALLHWDAIQEYVEAVLKIAFPTPQSLVNDASLQQWFQELVSPKLGDMESLLPPERSDQLNGLSNIDDLIAIVTNVIFTATAYHAAVNFGQTDYYTWIPNAQFATYRPYSDILNGNGKRQFKPLQRLPGRALSIRQMVLSRSLSIGPPITSDSLMTMTCLLQDPAAKQAFARYRQRLVHIEKEITERNRTREQPYLYLLPSMVPQSIAI
ncbi:lipoxygenase family protein [Sorangium sp. So ce1000]|uniref:lipoxygenase family protein n=1 Tax=Sorangium sp. So ce1000 TaxID=3133325 RepID=UPI003F629EB9